MQPVDTNWLDASPPDAALQSMPQPLVNTFPGFLLSAAALQPPLQPSPSDVEKKAEEETEEQAQKAVKIFQALAGSVSTADRKT